MKVFMTQIVNHFRKRAFFQLSNYIFEKRINKHAFHFTKNEVAKILYRRRTFFIIGRIMNEGEESYATIVGRARQIYCVLSLIDLLKATGALFSVTSSAVETACIRYYEKLWNFPLFFCDFFLTARPAWFLGDLFGPIIWVSILFMTTLMWLTGICMRFKR